MVARLFGHGRRAARDRRPTACSSSSASTDAGDRLVRTYSGGMRRRLDLGASLVGAPQLLLLDEPTTGLDPRSRNELWDAIEQLVAAGTDVLLTTQYLEEADQLADQIAIIDHGRLVASGTAGRAEGPGRPRRRRGPQLRDAADLGRAAELLGAEVHVDAEQHAAERAGPATAPPSMLAARRRASTAAGIAIDDVGAAPPDPRRRVPRPDRPRHRAVRRPDEESPHDHRPRRARRTGTARTGDHRLRHDAVGRRRAHRA